MHTEFLYGRVRQTDRENKKETETELCERERERLQLCLFVPYPYPQNYIIIVLCPYLKLFDCASLLVAEKKMCCNSEKMLRTKGLTQP